ncbi:PREDICTED: cation channel sperm-associated protein subunit delta [Charadrius vociferus]|uniref:cation channel sperm-associated protein subunit delta n=1 Tax=Charadrius vociferus TaxID=50402 RepID=UPI0005218730|nr:PREDICTED: cation channel sperm-associated protein subunit delta [Charadrius vociferus]
MPPHLRQLQPHPNCHQQPSAARDMAPGTWQALVAKLWLCLWVCGGGSGCSHAWLAHSIHFSHDAKPARGIHVSYCGSSPLVLQHSCEGHGLGRVEPKVAVYPGKEVFISLDASESSLSLLPILKEREAEEATVSAIAFLHKDGVSMVVNSQVLCQPRLPFTERSYTFTRIETSTREQGVLLSIYNFTSFAVTGLLTDRSGEDEAGKAAGAYARHNGAKNSHMSNHSSTTFHLLPKGPAKLYSIQNLALRGFIILWTTDHLLLSANNCLIMEKVTVVHLVTFQSTTFPNNIFLLVTVSSSQIAVLTQDRHLFYSSISQVTSVVYIAKDECINLKNSGIPFEERRAMFVPKPGKRSTPLVTVSSAHELAFSADVIEVELTYGGNTEYLLHFVPVSEFEVTDFYNSVVSCPPAKHIRIVKNVTPCDEGLIREAALRNNSSCTISHNLYHSYFLAREDMQQDNLQTKYNFTNLRCCLLEYYKNSWVPVFELRESNRFQKHVPAEFVLFEINGMHNSDYLLTACGANCISQPQNWTTLLEEQKSPDPQSARTRSNYVSCKNRNGPELKRPSGSILFLMAIKIISSSLHIMVHLSSKPL